MISLIALTGGLAAPLLAPLLVGMLVTLATRGSNWIISLYLLSFVSRSYRCYIFCHCRWYCISNKSVWSYRYVIHLMTIIAGISISLYFLGGGLAGMCLCGCRYPREAHVIVLYRVENASTYAGFGGVCI